MRRLSLAARAVFAAVVVTGTLTDVPGRSAPASGTLLVGDFHVHAMPGDGFLPVWEIQREASRRGVDVIAITNHNHSLALRIGQRLGLLTGYPIVIPGQEVTSPSFHMTAVGVTTMVDSDLSAREALDAIHAQGGVGIAAHPFKRSWIDADVEALRRLDGAEVAHPSMAMRPSWDAELRAFYETARQVNPDLAAIGSSDFHGGRVGLYCTHVTVDEVSQEGILEGIRRGRTVALGPRQSACSGAVPDYGLHTVLALVALVSLAVVVVRS